MSKRHRKIIWQCLALVAAAVAFSIWSLTSEKWPRLRQIDRSLSVLDDPIQLMKLASAFVSTNEEYIAKDETRHEAIRALLKLQNRKFGIHTQSPAETGTGIDHIYVWPEPYMTNVYLRLIATPSKKANIPVTESVYWSMESLDFDKEGRLIKRLAYNQRSNE